MGGANHSAGLHPQRDALGRIESLETLSCGHTHRTRKGLGRSGKRRCTSCPLELRGERIGRTQALHEERRNQRKRGQVPS